MVVVWVCYGAGEQPVTTATLKAMGAENMGVYALMNSSEHWDGVMSGTYEVRRWEVSRQEADALDRDAEANETDDYEWSCAVQKHAKSWYRGTEKMGGEVVAKRGNVRNEPGLYDFGSAPQEPMTPLTRFQPGPPRATGCGFAACVVVATWSGALAWGLAHLG